MIRRTPLKRSKKHLKRTPIKKSGWAGRPAGRTPVKKKRSHPRRGPLRDKTYREWVSRFSDIVATQGALVGPWESRMSDACHTVNNGMASKGPDSSCVPLTRTRHREYDAGRAAFERKYGVNMKAIAALMWERYQREKAA